MFSQKHLTDLIFPLQNPTFAQPSYDPRLQADLHDILTNIEQLHAQGQFSGCITRFFKIIEMCANKRPVNFKNLFDVL